MEKYMDNVKEISSIQRTNRTSMARDRFRYLNASHRNSNRSSNYRSYKRMPKVNNVEREKFDVDEDKMSEKIDKSFKRLMVSTGLVAFVLAIKLMDNSFTNKLEGEVTNLIRSSSEFDYKISNQLVSLSEKMGININGINNINQSSDTVEDIDLNAVDINRPAIDGVAEEVVEKTEISDEEVTDSERLSEEQVTDFYIDDSVFEEIKGDTKK